MRVRVTLFNTGATLLFVAVGVALGIYLDDRMGVWALLGVFAMAGIAFASAQLAMRWRYRREMADLDRLLAKQRETNWRA